MKHTIKKVQLKQQFNQEVKVQGLNRCANRMSVLMRLLMFQQGGPSTALLHVVD